MIQTFSKVYSLLFIFIPFYIFLQLLRYNTTISTKLHLFNHTFSTTLPKSTVWITPQKRRINHDSDEKYLTFFTHSGFQNQLIQGTCAAFVVIFY